MTKFTVLVTIALVLFAQYFDSPLVAVAACMTGVLGLWLLLYVGLVALACKGLLSDELREPGR